MLAANLRSEIQDFRGLEFKQSPNSKGWNSDVHRASPGKFESTNLAGDHLRREMGRRTGSPRKRGSGIREVCGLTASRK